MTLRGEKASAYLWVVTVMLVLLLLAGIFLSMTASDYRLAYSFACGLAAASLAESGAEYGVNRLYPQLYNVARPEHLPPVNISGERHERPFAGVYGVEHGYTLHIRGPDEDNRYTVESTGTFQKAKRTVRIVLRVNFENGASWVSIEEWKQLPVAN